MSLSITIEKNFGNSEKNTPYTLQSRITLLTFAKIELIVMSEKEKKSWVGINKLILYYFLGRKSLPDIVRAGSFLPAHLKTSPKIVTLLSACIIQSHFRITKLFSVCWTTTFELYDLTTGSPGLSLPLWSFWPPCFCCYFHLDTHTYTFYSTNFIMITISTCDNFMHVIVAEVC